MICCVLVMHEMQHVKIFKVPILPLIDIGSPLTSLELLCNRPVLANSTPSRVLGRQTKNNL